MCQISVLCRPNAGFWVAAKCLGLSLALGAAVLFTFASSALAQGLNWEGQTGAFITPFAYTSASPATGFGRPQASFHYMDTGNVIGGYIQTSVTIGFLKRAEFGFTRSVNLTGTTAGLSPLFEGGFNTFHGKVNFVPENVSRQNYMPAISGGFVARTQVRHVGGVINSRDTRNGDFYLVATKTVTQVKGLPFLVNLGFKGTNSSIFGIAGNATAWQGRWFGAAAFVLNGPAGSVVVLGSEFAQQPDYIEGLAGATVPTTLTYFVRIVPAPERLPLNVDFGVAQAVGNVTPGVELKARAQFAMGISYQF